MTALAVIFVIYSSLRFSDKFLSYLHGFKKAR